MGVSIKGVKPEGVVHVFRDSVVGPTGPNYNFTNGSIAFDGTNYLTVGQGSSWNIGTGDFTIEWFQKYDALNQFPRIFTIGLYPNAYIAVSIESDTLYFWMNGSYVLSVPITDYIGQWAHFAVTRRIGTVNIFKDGVRLGRQEEVTADIGDSEDPLAIGAEPGNSNTYFIGKITNFRYTKGFALYNGTTYDVPTENLTDVTPSGDVELLLVATDAPSVITDTSFSAHDTYDFGVVWSSEHP